LKLIQTLTMRPFLLLVPLAIATGWTAERVGSRRALEAGTALRVNLEGLVDRSELVLEGRILSAVSRPAPGRIETVYELEIKRTFLGEERARRTVVMPGGVLPDGTGMILPGVPRLRVGEDAILFLSAESAGGMRVTVGLSQGRFQVETPIDGRRFVVRDHGDLGLLNSEDLTLSEAPAPERFDYAELVAKIHAACDVRKRRERGSKR
jgi:hypothetical protein